MKFIKVIISIFIVQTMTVIASGQMTENPLSAQMQADREIIRTIVEYYIENNKLIQAELNLQEHLKKDSQDIEAMKTLGM